MSHYYIIIIIIIIIIINIIIKVNSAGWGGGSTQEKSGKRFVAEVFKPWPYTKMIHFPPCLRQENFFYDPDLVSFGIKNYVI